LLQQAINGNIPASVASSVESTVILVRGVAAIKLISNSFLLPEPLALLDHSPEFLVWSGLLVDQGLHNSVGFANLDGLHRELKAELPVIPRELMAAV